MSPLEFLHNPLNIGLLALAAFLVYQNHLKPAAPKPSPKPARVTEQRDYTPNELQKMNGESNELIYIAIKGEIYDVTSSKSFYGPGSAYENFAGRDASRGMAKNSFSDEVLRHVDGPIDDLSDLTSEELESLDEWAAFFKNKYPRVGRLLPNKEQ